MAKKTKRKVSSVTTTEVAQERDVETVETSTTSAASTPYRSAVPSRRAATSTEFNPDYSYVVKDLKRIGTLAGAFFVILIVLSFIL